MPKPSPCFYETSLRNGIFQRLKNFQGHPTAKCPKRSNLCSECLQEVYNRKQTLVYVERSGFPMSFMLSVAVSKVSKSSIFFVEPGAKVNDAYYREKLLASMIPEMDRLTGYQPYVFMQDGLDLILQIRRLDS